VDIYPAVNAAEAITAKRSDVAKIEQSPISQMPPGLINGLNAEEVRDLIAYLMSGGDPKDKVYGE
jgi:cytochrome c1